MAIGCIFTMYAFDFAMIDVVKEQYFFNTDGIMVAEKNISSFPYGIVIPLLGIFTLGTMLLYKNRPLQLKLGRLNYILHLFLIVMMFYSIESAVTEINQIDITVVKYGIGFYLPIASLPFLFLANRAIKRDEEMVKAIDRLR